MTSFKCRSNLKYLYAGVAAWGLSVFPARRNAFKLIFGFVKMTYENDFLKILQNFFFLILMFYLLIRDR